MFGYTGCDYGHVEYSFFQSTLSNGAAEIAPELCPLGKFGYDARCRGWYKSAKEKEVYISSPYLYASGIM